MHACMHAPIAANVYPVVGRLVECASKHEITLRFRNPVTTGPPLVPPSRPRWGAALALSRDFISRANPDADSPRVGILHIEGDHRLDRLSLCLSVCP